jgi:transposase
LLYWPELLHPVEPRSLESEQNRALLRLRESLVRARVKLINSVRGVLASFGEKLPAVSSAAFARAAAPLVPELLRSEVHPALLTIEMLTAEVKVYDKRVLELCKGRYREQTRRQARIEGLRGRVRRRLRASGRPKRPHQS